MPYNFGRWDSLSGFRPGTVVITLLPASFRVEGRRFFMSCGDVLMSMIDAKNMDFDDEDNELYTIFHPPEDMLAYKLRMLEIATGKPSMTRKRLGKDFPWSNEQVELFGVGLNEFVVQEFVRGYDVGVDADDWDSCQPLGEIYSIEGEICLSQDEMEQLWKDATDKFRGLYGTDWEAKLRRLTRELEDMN